MTRIYRLLLALLIVLASASAAFGREAILSYHSDIQVLRDGAMNVTETIRVQAEGNKIKRGIYRDFPTTYWDSFGKRYQVEFSLSSVQRDGQDEPYHTKALNNGIRIYIGHQNVHLENGVYTYALRYRTSRQLGFFDDHDELYWNVTGNGWDFPIQQATARVTLPPEIPADQIGTEAYTGPQGAKGVAYRAGVDDEGVARFTTTQRLASREGLTIVVTWPKGYVTEPTRGQRIDWFLQQNRSTIVSFGGCVLLLIYYLLVWRAVGRDPEAGVIIPLYTPPKNFSPAAMRFIRGMGYDEKTFTVAVVNLAVKGYLQIREASNGEFTLRKTGNRNLKVSRGEGAVASALLGGKSSITLKQKNHVRIGKALQTHKHTLKREYEKVYFLTNSGYLIPGILISILTLVFCLVTLSQQGDAAPLTLIFFVLTGITSLLVIMLYKAWREAIGGGTAARAIFFTLFTIPVAAGEIGIFVSLVAASSVIYPIPIIVIVLLNILFYQWLKAPTLAGRRLLDKMEGFRLFLSVAEADELNFRNPPEKTPALFEAYLPYALALDVEQQWAERFNSVLSRVGTEEYQPSWYRGDSWSHHNLSAFTGAIGGAMSSAVASSSNAPGSSSGSGGGGSSGGGGGGGGGGGW